MIDLELSDMEILQYAVSNGMIDTESLQKSIEMKKKEEYLKKHQYAINKGKDGYWRTYLPDEEKTRKLIKKKEKEALEEAIVNFYKDDEALTTKTFDEMYKVFADDTLSEIYQVQDNINLY